METLPALQTATDIALATSAEGIETGAVHMAKEFCEATAEIARLMLAIQTQSCATPSRRTIAVTSRSTSTFGTTASPNAPTTPSGFSTR